MPNLIDSATAILVSSEKRAQSSAQDISNASTNGYKQQVDFAHLLQPDDNRAQALPELAIAHDFKQGQLIETGNPFDLAIFGPAFIAMRSENGIVFGRGGMLDDTRGWSPE